MNDECLFVLDTNVLISAALFYQSQPRRALEKAQDTGIVLMSSSTLLELENVLARPKFDKYLSLSERQRFLFDLLKTIQFISISKPIQACRDPKDNQYLELAVSGNANCIVTGDSDLLDLHPFQTIPILNVQTFLKTSF